MLALLKKEPGEAVVADAVASGASLSSTNLAEVLSHFADQGADPAELLDRLFRGGVLGTTVRLEPLEIGDVVETARLRPLTRHAGLSLADRACLALARRLDLPVLTADTEWDRVDVGVEVRQIR